jgi:hypothetical protein
MYGYHRFFSATSFSNAFGHFDEDRVRETKMAGCPCGGRLDVANYLRKPRGGPPGLEDSHALRLSLCCARDGCRRRATPPSIRFLGRRVYFGAVVVLVSAMRHDITKLLAAKLYRLLGVSERTLRRWRQWWLETFTASSFWTSERARFMPPVTQADLPRSLIERFLAPNGSLELVAVMRFLSPLTTGKAFAPEHAF